MIGGRPSGTVAWLSIRIPEQGRSTMPTDSRTGALRALLAALAAAPPHPAFCGWLPWLCSSTRRER